MVEGMVVVENEVQGEEPCFRRVLPKRDRSEPN